VRITPALIVIMGFLGLAVSPEIARSGEGDPPQSILDDPDYDPSIPWYQSLKSSWGVQFRTGFRNFPAAGAAGNLFQISADWVVPFQRAGIFSIGPTLGGVKDLPVGITSQSVLMAGGLLRYQLKIFKNQPVVPTAALGFDHYRIPNGAPLAQMPDGNQMSFSYGIMLNLSWIDQVTARDAYQSLGMTKAYLTAEVLQTNYENAVFAGSPVFYLFGIKLEFE
jgi:hypothetical protein